MKIKISNKYLTLYDNNDIVLAYFEHFESKNEKKNVIAISSENKKGDNFIKNNNYIIQNADVYWFGSKKLVKKVMFVKEKNGAFDFIVLITPKLLTNH